MITYEFKKRIVEEVRSHFQDLTRSENNPENARFEKVFRFLLLPKYCDQDPIADGALVELALLGPDGALGAHALYLLVPTGGGLVTSVDGRPIQVVTPLSPVGAAIVGRKTGDEISVPVRDSVRIYRVIEVC